MKFQFGKEDAKKLSETIRQYVGRQLFFAVGDNAVSSPTVRDVLKATVSG